MHVGTVFRHTTYPVDPACRVGNWYCVCGEPGQAASGFPAAIRVFSGRFTVEAGAFTNATASGRPDTSRLVRNHAASVRAVPHHHRKDGAPSRGLWLQLGVLDHGPAVRQDTHDRLPVEFGVLPCQTVERPGISELVQHDGHGYPRTGHDRFSIASAGVDLDERIDIHAVSVAQPGAHVKDGTAKPLPVSRAIRCPDPRHILRRPDRRHRSDRDLIAIERNRR